MTDLQHDDPPSAQFERGRRAARRTAWVVAGIALLVYLGFLVLGTLGR